MVEVVVTTIEDELDFFSKVFQTKGISCSGCLFGHIPDWTRLLYPGMGFVPRKLPFHLFLIYSRPEFTFLRWLIILLPEFP